MSTHQRRFRAARSPALRATAPATRATALALAGFLARGGSMTWAAQAAEDKEAAAAKAAAAAKVLAAAKQAAAAEAAAAEAAANQPIPVIEGGRVVGQKTREDARKEGLTVVDLSDDWLPYVFSETPEKPQPLRPYLIDLANGRVRPGRQYARAREDRFFEAFGIFPSLNYLR